MSNKFTTHMFTYISAERGLNPLSVSAITIALETLESEYQNITKAEGEDIAENVLSYGAVKRALQQCLAYHENSNPDITYEDNCIYYEYTYLKLAESEKMAEE